MTRRAKIAVYSIAKNEALHAVRWAQTAADADYRVVLDTGSDDNTVEQLDALGVDVHEPVPPMVPFRFDWARNAALALVPEDTDLCISLDLDEILAPDFIERLRDLWDELGPFDKARPWFNTGTWWRCDRVHARHGYEWVAPCHEVTTWIGEPGDETIVNFEGTMEHWPDNDKPRTNYLPLLELAVHEKPADARMWVYLVRERHFAGAWDDVLRDGQTMSATPGGWPAERAATRRLMAHAAEQLHLPNDRIEAYLHSGTIAAPGEAEAWGALAKFHYDRNQWSLCADAALAGIENMVRGETHYLTDHALRDWGLWDFAAVALHEQGFVDRAVECGYRAWVANPDDGRLRNNLREYVRLQAIPTFAIIPTVAGERRGETAVLVEQLERQGVTCFVDDSLNGIHEKWNRGIADAAARVALGTVDKWNVLVINNDVSVAEDFIAIMVGALRHADGVGVAHPHDGSGAFTGWAFMLRGEDGYRVDERFEWWYGDTDLVVQIEDDDRSVVTCPPVPIAVHSHPNESTWASPGLMAAAIRDERRYAEKWGIDPATLFLARNPEWRARAGVTA